MSQIPQTADKSLSSYRYFVSLLLKLIGLVLLAFSIGYWARLVGIFDAAIGFDTLPSYWKAAGAALVILMPIAALGLWGNAKWGVVVWMLVVIIEIVMYGFYPQLFGEARSVLFFHIVSVLVFVVSMLLVFYVEQKNIGGQQI